MTFLDLMRYLRANADVYQHHGSRGWIGPERRPVRHRRRWICVDSPDGTKWAQFNGGNWPMDGTFFVGIRFGDRALVLDPATPEAVLEVWEQIQAYWATPAAAHQPPPSRPVQLSLIDLLAGVS